MKFTARITPEDMQRVRDLLSDDHCRAVVETGIKRGINHARRRFFAEKFRRANLEVERARFLWRPRPASTKRRSAWFVAKRFIRLV